jgi:hypothetical protein
MTTRATVRELIGDESEAHFQQRVVHLAIRLGWDLRYHTYDSTGSAPGFPDWVLVNERLGRVVFAELKSEHGAYGKDQRRWIAALQACGQEAFFWRPRDWEQVKYVLGAA